MIRISLADPIFYPIAAILTMVFVLLLIGFIPQSNQEIGQRADLQNARLEIISMTATLLHGKSYKTPTPDPVPLRDSHSISYMICGRNPDNSWVQFNPENKFDYGTPQIPSFYEYNVIYQEDPAGCTSTTNYWEAPQNNVGGGQQAMTDRFVTIIPIRGGGKAKIEARYGVQ